MRVWNKQLGPRGAYEWQMGLAQAQEQARALLTRKTLCVYVYRLKENHYIVSTERHDALTLVNAFTH